MKNWFRMETSGEAPAVADIYIFDIIGGWLDDMYRAFGYDFGTTTAKTFLDELAKVPESVKTLRLHINSPGGDVFGAFAIANTLRDQKASKGRTVKVSIDGLAASAGSVIAMAGDTVEMADTALLMIHNPWTVAVGNEKDFAKVIGELQKLQGRIVASYKWHSSLEPGAIQALMDAETWMDADEAVTAGFATQKTEGLKAAALITPAAMAAVKVPEKFKAKAQAFVQPPPSEPPQAASALEVIRACKAAGVVDIADELVAAGATMAQVEARVTEVKTTRDADAKRASDAAQAEASRAADIRALCAAAKCPAGMAESYIRGGMPVAEVRGQLAIVRALADGKEIETGLAPANGHNGRPIDVFGEYAALSKRHH